MGTTYIEGVVTGPSGEHATLEFLVDSGASYTLLPEPEELGLVLNRFTRELQPMRMMLA